MIALKNVVSSKFVERVHAFFSANGPLSKAKNFEFRPQQQEMAARIARALEEEQHVVLARSAPPSDRKSTRLNSSHVRISYAVFCLKKKKKKQKKLANIIQLNHR